MKKLDQLFVRACKTLRPEQRVRSVYRRYYTRQPVPDRYVIGILAELCDTYVPMSAVDLVRELSPKQVWMNTETGGYSYDKECLRVLINRIRFSEVREFPSMTAPLRFRK